MKIGIAGPISLEPVLSWLPPGVRLPPVYSFPLIGRLAAALRSRGHFVTLFAGSEAVARTEKWSGDGVEIVVCPRRSGRSSYDFYRQERASLVEAMKISPVDLIHAHWCYEFAAAALESRRPVLITAHDCPDQIARFFRWTTAFPHWFFRSWLGYRVCRRAQHLSCVSPYVETHIRRYAKAQAMVCTIPNGVPSSLFALGKARAENSARTEPIKIVTVLEGFGRRKNARLALQTFPWVRQKFPAAELHLYGGDFQAGGPADQWATSRGLSTNVFFRGKLPQAELHRELHSSATLFLHPSLEEAHPMAIVEAMALGIPVVGGRKSGGVPFTLDQGRAGVLADLGDPEGLARTLQNLLSTPSQCQTIARAGWEYAHQHFREEEMVDQYLKVYAGLNPLREMRDD